MVGSMVDIQFPTAEIRRGKKKKERKKIEETTGWKHNKLYLIKSVTSSSITNFTMPQLQTKCGVHAFSHAGPASWNALPEDMRAVSDFVVFRNRLKTPFSGHLL